MCSESTCTLLRRKFVFQGNFRLDTMRSPFGDKNGTKKCPCYQTPNHQIVTLNVSQKRDCLQHHSLSKKKLHVQHLLFKPTAELKKMQKLNREIGHVSLVSLTFPPIKSVPGTMYTRKIFKSSTPALINSIADSVNTRTSIFLGAKELSLNQTQISGAS